LQIVKHDIFCGSQIGFILRGMGIGALNASGEGAGGFSKGCCCISLAGVDRASRERTCYQEDKHGETAECGV
jgi:hypothetical protein